MRLTRAILCLTRPYTSVLSFLSILLPVYVRTNSLGVGVSQAAPLLFISICTFVINDLDDVEKDRINHPERPLPSGEISPNVVVVFYYICLALALFTTRFGVTSDEAAFLYYLILTLSISYGYVVEYLPTIKAPYVAGTSTLPVLILTALFPNEHALYLIAFAVFAFMLGRELCLDVIDRPGDPVSLLHKVDNQRIAIFAFASQGAGLLLISFQIATAVALLVFLTMVVSVALASMFWFWHRQRRVATGLMKVTVYLGLYFLVT